jgi:predicted  nucleic acid-binding Zn-ribbon protein
MFSDQELRKIENTIQRLREDIRRLHADEAEDRETADRAIKRIQVNLERDVAITKRRIQDLEHEIVRHEHDLENRKQELEKSMTNTR